MPRYLIVNADDFGLTPGVSRGILRAYRQGILTSTSFMVNLPWAAEQAALLQEVPELGVGIHLNLTTGSPLLPPGEIPSLVGARGQFSKALLHLRFRVDMADAEREWRAQLERGIALLGRTPTHLDTHKYLQGFPGYATVMLNLAREFGIPAVRHIYPEMVPPGTFTPSSPLGHLLMRYLRKSAGLVTNSGLAHTDATVTGSPDEEGLLRKLESLGDGVTELISHPGEADEQLRALSSLREQREVELQVLTSPVVRARLESLAIRLVSFRHLAK